MRKFSTEKSTLFPAKKLSAEYVSPFGDEILSLSSNDGAPGAIPTRDLPLRRRTLYATELREHMTENSKGWQFQPQTYQNPSKPGSLASGLAFSCARTRTLVRDSGRLTIAQQFTAGNTKGREVQSVKRTADDNGQIRSLAATMFDRYRTARSSELLGYYQPAAITDWAPLPIPIPAVNCWAILIRPQRGLTVDVEPPKITLCALPLRTEYS